MKHDNELNDQQEKTLIKKPYDKPELRVYGTIEKITQQGGLLVGDALVGGSVIG